MIKVIYNKVMCFIKGHTWDVTPDRSGIMCTRCQKIFDKEY